MNQQSVTQGKMKFPRYLTKHQELRNKVALEILAPMFTLFFQEAAKSSNSDQQIKEARDAMIEGAFSMADLFIKESKK